MVVGEIEKEREGGGGNYVAQHNVAPKMISHNQDSRQHPEIAEAKGEDEAELYL